MTVKAFGPVLVVDDLGVPVGATVGAFTDPDTGVAIPALGLDGVTPVTVATSPRGVTGQWMLDVPATGYVFATFGGMRLALAPLGADPVAGLPVGGTTGQALVKASGADGDVVWQTVAGGSGSVASVNGKTGAVVLTAADVGARPDTYVPSWVDVTGKPSTFPPAPHSHAAADVTSGVLAPARLGTGSADATKVLYGDGTWKDAPSGGGGGGAGLPLVTPQVGWYFSSPTLFGGTDNKPSGYQLDSYVPGYGGVVKVNEVSIQVDTADAAGGPVTITIKAAGTDGFPTATVLSTTSHATTATGRIAVATSFTIPAEGCWISFSTYTGSARLRVANYSLIGGMGAGSAPGLALSPLSPSGGNGAQPGVLVMRRSA